MLNRFLLTVLSLSIFVITPVAAQEAVQPVGVKKAVDLRPKVKEPKKPEKVLVLKDKVTVEPSKTTNIVVEKTEEQLKPIVLPEVRKPIELTPPKPKNIVVVVDKKKVEPPKLKTDEKKVKVVFKREKAYLKDYTAYFKSSFEDTFLLFITSLPKQRIDIESFDTEKGHIFCKYADKMFYAIIVPQGEKMTLVRLTPIDGIYDVSASFVKNIFVEMQSELSIISKLDKNNAKM